MGSPASRLEVHVGQLTDKGRKESNEDAVGIRLPPSPMRERKGLALAVADGVSGAEGGREAAELAVQGFLSDYYTTPDSWSIKTSADKVLQSINRWLHGRGQHYSEAHRGYLSTLTTLVLKDCQAHIFHVGDTRIYRLREGLLERLTQDHVVRLGNQDQLTRALGLDWRIDLDYRQADLKVGDTLCCCSDGLYRFIPLPALTRTLADLTLTPEQRCQRLHELALENGSDDNISVQIADIVSLPSLNQDDQRLMLNELPFPPALVEGQILDGYRIIQELSASSRSQLYLVRDTGTDQLLVMKTPAERYNNDAPYIEHFIMEEWLGLCIDSPHVIQTLSPSHERRYLYTLNEYLEGITLREWASQNPLPAVQHIAPLIQQVIAGLRALHRREILHQDLKSDNVLLLKDKSLKIIDLGSARSGSQGEATEDTPPGTRECSAPEYRVGGAIGARSDQFSLALMIYELLTGRHPFGTDAYTRAETPRDFSRLSYTPAFQYNPHVPIWYDAALRKALSLTPDHRYDSLSELQNDLQRPNPQLDTRRQPLLERHPVRVWQAVAMVSLLTNLLLLAWIFH